MGAHVRSFFMEPNQYNKKWIKKFCQVERGCTVLTAIETSIDDLIPYENNPRNNDGAVEAVAASIRAIILVKQKNACSGVYGENNGIYEAVDK